jgi:hypothetical protein
MSGRVTYTGNIVTNGLVLNLDAGKLDSYPRSGTTWRDISGNGNNATLVNGPTFNNGNNGSIVFDGINDHSTISTTVTSAYSELTVEIIFKSSVAGNSGTGYLLWDHTVTAPIWLGKTQGNEWYWFWNYAGARAKSARLSSTSYVADSWIHIAVRAHLSNTTRISETNNFAELIVNGTNYSTAHRNDSDLTLNYPTTSMYLARRGASIGNGELGTTVSEYANIEIGMFKLYNRVLTRNEILQNFNAVRGRYGI